MPQAFGFALGFLVPGAGVAFGSLAGFAGGAAFSGTITGMLLRTVALTVLQSAFTKKPTNPGVRSSVTLAGDTTPEATGVGLFVTAGRRTYPPKSIPNGTKPNVFTVNRIELSGMPGIALLRVLVGGEDAEVDWQATPHADFGQPFGGRFIDDGKVHGWVKFYDGHQTAADPMLVAKLGADPDHPYTAAMIGTGIAYAVVTLKWNPNVFRGDEWNSLQFECEGLPLYDPRSDSSVGGVGAQRWADPATWVTTRNPKVIEYNVRRGLVPAPGKVWGFRATESDLPLANWMAQMNACDEQVNIGGGLGPRYRCGFEFSFTEEPRAVTGRLNDACSGRVADMGGRWVGRAGPPGPAVATIVEGAGQLLVSEPGALDLFDGTETVVNALSAVFPDPASGWRERETPLFTKTEWVAEDGRVRQARLDLPAVPFPGRAQILAKEMVEDNRRQRRYVLPARAELAEVDLLETYALTILGDGFDAKDMELTGLVIDPATAAVQVAGREVNPADWTPPTVDTVFTAPVPVVRQDLPAQTVPGFDLRAATVTSGGQSRPGVEIVWTTSDDLRDWRGIVFEVRLAATGAVVARDTITDLKTGVYPVQHPATQFAATTYEARVQPYAPGVPVAWSTWRPATTPDIRLATADLADPVQVGVATASPAAQAAFSALEQMAAAREVSERIEGLVADALGTAQQALSEARIDLRAGIREGGAADPAFARWHGAVPADWTSSTDISGWAEPFRGRYGTGLALDIPAGSGTVDLVTPLDVDPAAEWLRIDLLVSYVAGDPAGVTLAVEYSADGGQTWTGAAALRGDPAADTFADLQLLPGAAIMEASIPARRPAGTWNAVRLRLRASTAGVPDAQSLRLHWLDVAVAGDTDERAAPGGPIDAAQAAADDALADAAAAFDRALRAPIGGWSADPTGARWSAPGVLDAAYWATEDAAGVLTQDTGAPSGSAIRFDIPSGGRSTAVLPVLPGADPAAEWVVIVATVVFDAGDPLAQRFRAEWWDGAGWVNGDMLGAAAPNGDFATHGIAVAPGRIQIREVLVRRPATADGSTPPRLRFNAAVPGITSAQTLTLHRLDMRPATEAEIEAGPGGSWKVETDRLEIEKVTPTGAVNAVEDAIQASGGGSLANVTQRAIASVDSADVDVAISGALDAFASEVGGGGSALALENYLTSADTDFAIATSAQELSASLGVATYRPISQLLGEARWSVSPVGAISGLPSLPASGWTVSASGFLERAIPQTGNGTYAYLKQITEVAEGDTVEVTWLAQTTGTGLGGTSGAATRVYWLDETFQQVGSFAAGLQDLMADNQPQQRSFTAVAPAGARYARAGFSAGWDAYSADGGVF
ncbi:MAG: hypothetical protein H5U20_03150, partial [Rhodobacteraceae bacterium]|nr:hypothetical protein [Paracoccaceae bacterium]